MPAEFAPTAGVTPILADHGPARQSGTGQCLELARRSVDRGQEECLAVRDAVSVRCHTDPLLGRFGKGLDAADRFVSGKLQFGEFVDAQRPDTGLETRLRDGAHLER